MYGAQSAPFSDIGLTITEHPETHMRKHGSDGPHRLMTFRRPRRQRGTVGQAASLSAP